MTTMFTFYMKIICEYIYNQFSLIDFEHSLFSIN